MSTTTPEQMRTLTKVCNRCHRTLAWANFYANTKWPDGTMRSPWSWCRQCENARCRERRRAAGDAHRDAERERIRQIRREIMADPAAHAAYLARQREYAASHRRKIGMKPRLAAVPSAERVPVAPLVEWIEEQYRQDPDLSRVDMAALLGVDQKQLYNWEHGLQHTVSLDVIDRAFCRLGMPEKLNEMWPVDDEAMVA